MLLMLNLKKLKMKKRKIKYKNLYFLLKNIKDSRENSLESFCNVILTINEIEAIL